MAEIPFLADPPWQKNAEGLPRRCGVEIEMNGVTLDHVTQLLSKTFSLSVSAPGRYERLLSGDPAGDWVVELDFDLLKKMGRQEHERETFSGELNDSAEALLKKVSLPLVPLEIVTPPLPLDRLIEVEKLIVALRHIGARGTSDQLTNAFGMQFNPEIHSKDPHQLSAFIKAFLCCYEWLYERSKVNLMRRMTRFAEPFPRSYVLKVIDLDYWPDQAVLIDDYLADNPTRNRALDCLPLFAYLDESRVMSVIDDQLVKPRPTWHYRLPNCEIDRADWGLYVAWNDWVLIEKLAANEETLKNCCLAYHVFLSNPVDRLMGNWVDEFDQRWLVNL